MSIVKPVEQLKRILRICARTKLFLQEAQLPQPGKLAGTKNVLTDGIKYSTHVVLVYMKLLNKKFHSNYICIENCTEFILVQNLQHPAVGNHFS